MDRVHAAIAEAVDAGDDEIRAAEYRFRHADGHWVWLSSVASGRLSPTNGFVVNSRDVTERRAFESALEAEHHLYESVVEGVNDAIVISRDGEFVFANSQSHELFGYGPGELVGTVIEEVIDPADRAMVAERGSRRLDAEQPEPLSRYEVRFLTRSGDRIVGEVNSRVIRYEGDLATLVAVRDVTEQYEERLEARNEELEALNRVVRHDIRNDMTVILGWAELLENHVDGDREHLEKMLSSGQHVVELTDIARDFVETLTSDVEPELRAISLRSTLSTELDHVREFYPDASFVVDGTLVDADVRANEMLSSVFTNLLRNGVQHNHDPEPGVTVSTEVEDGDAVVRIADDGPGGPDDVKEQIFGKGEKGLDRDGTGIGLYLVRTLVGQYGGTVHVEDNESSGAVCVVRLPIAD